jgi:protein-S-isoprenylcysteine O-methyltransferase Ste14
MTHIVRLPPVLFFSFLAIGSVLHNVFPVSLGLHSLTPAFLAGSGMLLCAFAIASAALFQMRKHRTPVEPGQQPTALVTSGIFARTRNPLYLSLVLVLGGIAVMTDALWLAVASIGLSLTLDRVVIQSEERLLDRTFPDQYASYKRRVRRWL